MQHSTPKMRADKLAAAQEESKSQLGIEDSLSGVKRDELSIPTTSNVQVDFILGKLLTQLPSAHHMIKKLAQEIN